MAGWFEPEPTGPWAWLVAAVVTTVAGWWKVRLKVRKDQREDKEGEVVAESYGAIIEQQRKRINELVADFAEMRKEIHTLRNDLLTAHTERDEARLRARDAEREVEHLKARIATLENEVRTLKAR